MTNRTEIKKLQTEPTLKMPNETEKVKVRKVIHTKLWWSVDVVEHGESPKTWYRVISAGWTREKLCFRGNHMLGSREWVVFINMGPDCLLYGCPLFWNRGICQACFVDTQGVARLC